MKLTFSKNFARVKPGHPEGYVDAFANIYNEVADHINSKNKKKEYIIQQLMRDC